MVNMNIIAMFSSHQYLPFSFIWLRLTTGVFFGFSALIFGLFLVILKQQKYMKLIIHNNQEVDYLLLHNIPVDMYYY